MEFNDLIKKRASVRNFSFKKPDMEDIIKIIQAANLSPAPGNIPLLSYIIIEDKEIISQISDACQQKFIKDAPYLVVVCSDKKNCEKLYDERTDKYIKHHAGAAIENFLLKTTDMGLASCWVGAFSDFTIKNLLAIPDNIDIEAIFPVGYESNNSHTKQKTKPPLEKRIWFEKYKNKFQMTPSKIRRDDT